MPPLDGVHVLDLSMLLPGPLCTQILRDLGARITKIEPPSPGDYMAHWPPMVGPVAATYFAVNRGKEITSLNLKDDADRQRFYELAKSADVVVEGFRPGVIDKLGIGYETLARLNPRIVVCSISGYGQDGPYVLRGGHDMNYQALAGVLSISGGGKHPPNPPLQVADTAAGSYAAAMLILAALLERQRTGQGRHIDVSMSEQLLPLMTPMYASAQAEERDPLSDGELLSGGAPCYRLYRTADGRTISIGALEPKFWQALVDAIGLPRLAERNHLVGPQAAETTAELAQVMATKTRDEWAAIFAAVDACVEPVLTFSEVRQHPHWQARKSFEAVPTPDGRTLHLPKMPGSLAGFDGARPS
ncbi:MAG: CoA transferase [Planctomycetaceae bacterium]|nr:CoA transferase [Planctomycetaceae bacterium]